MSHSTIAPSSSYHDIVIQELADGEADWREQAIDALLDVEAYRTLLSAALERLAERDRDLARARALAHSLRSQLRERTPAPTTIGHPRPNPNKRRVAA